MMQSTLRMMRKLLRYNSVIMAIVMAASMMMSSASYAEEADMQQLPEYRVQPAPPVAEVAPQAVPVPSTEPSLSLDELLEQEIISRGDEPAQPAGDDATQQLQVPAADTASSFSNKALLQGIDKVTARASSIEAPIDSSVFFGPLEIILRSCWKSPPEQMPENKALLEIWEHKPGELKKLIFHGWMFSSSPSISALEHPVYDITVLECMSGLNTTH